MSFAENHGHKNEWDEVLFAAIVWGGGGMLLITRMERRILFAF
jgi:hypothetical protein